jgi:hypothetical protein
MNVTDFCEDCTELRSGLVSFRMLKVTDFCEDCTELWPELVLLRMMKVTDFCEDCTELPGSIKCGELLS